MHKIKIIDYKAGNSQSVGHAVSRLGHEYDFVKTAADLQGATHIILPGVGSAKATMDALQEQDLLVNLNKMVLEDKVPFLGICVGLQILFEHSAEGDVACLGWLKGRVEKFDSSAVRVPQMGWNKLRFLRDAGGIKSIKPDPSEGREDSAADYFYFVNSYYAIPADPADQWATAHYGKPFTAAVHKENIFGMQFHVEKSGETGLNLLNCFIEGGTVC